MMGFDYLVSENNFDSKAPIISMLLQEPFSH